MAHEEQIEQYPILSAEAPEINPAIHDHFSAETINLIGVDTAVELVETHDALRHSLVENAEYFTQLSAQSPRSNINAYYSDPHNRSMTLEMRQQLAAFAATMKARTPLERYPTGIALYETYLKHKDSFVALPSEELEADVRTQEEVSQRITVANEAMAMLFGRYQELSGADHEGARNERAAIIAHMSHKISEVKALFSPNTRNELIVYLDVETVIARFMQLERVLQTTDPLAIVSRLLRDGLYNAENDVEPEHHPMFNSPTHSRAQLAEYRERFLTMATNDTRRSKGHFERFAAYIKEHDKIVAEVAKNDATEVMQLGTKAIKTAETALHQSIRQNMDMDVYPFSMLNPESDMYATEVEAIIRLESATRLARVQQEVGTILTHFPNIKKHDYIEKAWVETVSSLQAESSAEARAVLEGTIGRHLDGLVTQAKPITDIVAGKKPRPPKKFDKNNPPPEIAAEEIYNNLHREGIFTDNEKALIATVTTDMWERARTSGEAFFEMYNATADYADRHGCAAVVTKHPATKIAQFSPTAAFTELGKKLKKPVNRTKLAMLNTEQQARLWQAIEEMGSEE